MTHRPIPVITERQKDRFNKRVARRGPDECCLWLGSIDRDGYGTVGINYASYRATRVAYYLATGEDPGEFLILHSCDIPQCCNPMHLSLGTVESNVRDRVERKRTASGERSGNSAMTLAEVQEARRMDAEGIRQTAIAEKFGVTSAEISLLVRGKLWKASFDPSLTRNDRMKGENHPMAVMNADKVRSMRELSESGVSGAELGRRFGVSNALASLIVRRKIWKHVL